MEISKKEFKSIKRNLDLSNEDNTFLYYYFTKKYEKARNIIEGSDLIEKLNSRAKRAMYYLFYADLKARNAEDYNLELSKTIYNIEYIREVSKKETKFKYIFLSLVSSKKIIALFEQLKSAPSFSYISIVDENSESHNSSVINSFSK